jgi:hypothetical protein
VEREARVRVERACGQTNEERERKGKEKERRRGRVTSSIRIVRGSGNRRGCVHRVQEWGGKKKKKQFIHTLHKCPK